MVTVVHKFKKIVASQGIEVVDACINTPDGPWAGINPFLNGPCELYNGLISKTMENAWQYSKVYPEHADANGNPTKAYWDWATAGWNQDHSVRFPMGKGRAPLGCWWNGKMLGYIESRKAIYGPLFIKAAQATESFKALQELHNNCSQLFIRDWDGWDMSKHGMTSLTQVINNPKRKMGHGFFLKAMLENDPVLKLLEI